MLEISYHICNTLDVALAFLHLGVIYFLGGHKEYMDTF